MAGVGRVGAGEKNYRTAGMMGKEPVGARLEFGGPLTGCSSRLAFAETAICRPVVHHFDPFASWETKNGTLCGASPGRDARVAASFRKKKPMANRTSGHFLQPTNGQVYIPATKMAPATGRSQLAFLFFLFVQLILSRLDCENVNDRDKLSGSRLLWGIKQGRLNNMITKAPHFTPLKLSPIMIAILTVYRDHFFVKIHSTQLSTTEFEWAKKTQMSLSSSYSHSHN